VSRDRLAGYQAALQDWGVSARPEWIVPGLGYNEETGQHAMRTLLEAERKPRAVFAVSDLVAFGAMAVLDEVGLRVPEDIAFIGFDDIPAAANFRPPLTTMRQPLSDMGRLAAEYVNDLLAGKAEEPLQVTMETKPVVRVSCGSEPRAPTAPPPTNTRSADQHHRAVAI
jgi:LacI family transcriptional regulator